jgi:ABC-type Fe3+ transport system substrate-binding protein
MLAAGAFDAAVPFSVTRQTITAIEDGAPLTVITPDTVIAQPDMYFPMAKAPHPATTRLYIEFLMSPAFQQNLHEIVKKVPITPGAPIAPLAQDILKKELFFETTENFGNYDTRVEQHQALFITG